MTAPDWPPPSWGSRSDEDWGGDLGPVPGVPRLHRHRLTGEVWVVAWGAEGEATGAYRALSREDAVRALLYGWEDDPDEVEVVSMDPGDFPPLPPHQYEQCLDREVARLCGD